ncbi:C4-dicarboxylate transport protein [compost metagenome]
MQAVADRGHPVARNGSGGHEAPGRETGDEHDAAPVGDIDRLAGSEPLRFHIVELELGDDDADRAVLPLDPTRDVKARPFADRTHGEMLRLAVPHRHAEIFAEGVVVADEARRLTPIAGGNRNAVGADHINDGGVRVGGKCLQFLVQPLQCLIVVSRKRGLHLDVVGQHQRRRALAFEHGAQQRRLQIGIDPALGVDRFERLAASILAGKQEGGDKQDHGEAGEHQPAAAHRPVEICQIEGGEWGIEHGAIVHFFAQTSRWPVRKSAQLFVRVEPYERNIHVDSRAWLSPQRIGTPVANDILMTARAVAHRKLTREARHDAGLGPVEDIMIIDQSAEPRGKTPFYRHLYVQVLAAIAAGILLGHFYPSLGTELKPLGDAFIRLVKMIIAPVIFLTVATGIAGMTDLAKVGRVAGKAMIYFLTFSTLALIIGLIVANVVQPGAGMHIDPASLDAKAVTTFAEKAHEQTIAGFLMNIIPTTLVGAFADGDILQVLFISVLFGLALAMVGKKAEPVVDFLHALTLPVFKLVGILMKAAPIGAFGAMAFTIGKYGVASIANLAMLIGTFYLTSFLFVFLVLGAVARYNGFSIIALIRYIKEELLLVLGTSSSEAALPGLMSKMEKAGCKRSVVGLVIPTGYSFNLDGTNIYMTLAALFIAQAMDIPLSLGDQVLLLLVAMLSSKGAAGITGAGFITLAATLSVVPAVPVAGMALILGIDRFMSECRALTNFVGNAVATIVVAKWEGELDEAQMAAVLGGRAPAALPQPALQPAE